MSPTAFAEELRGGGERYPLELARSMAELVPTRLVTFSASPRRVRSGRLDIEVLPIRHLWNGDALNPLSIALIPELFRGRVIHAHQYRSILTNVCLATGRALRRRVFCTDHGGSARHYAAELRLGRLLTGFLAVSSFALGEFPAFASRSRVVYGGVDPDRFAPSPDVDRRREVVFVGRILPHKGLDVLIRALDDRTPLHIYGPAYDSDYRAALGLLAAGKQVTFHENASDDDIVAAYRRARVAVLPSVASSEYGFAAPHAELLGLVLLEAMACGTPVVASALGGVPEIVRDGETGFLVPPGDAASLADRLGLLLDGPAMWRSMSEAAVEHVHGAFTWRHVAERCLDAYETLRSSP